MSTPLKMIGGGICTIRNSLFVCLDCSSYHSLKVKQYSGGHEFHIIFTDVNFEGLLEAYCYRCILKLFFMYFLNFPFSLYGLNLFSSD